MHGTLAWALDEFLVIKVEDPTLVIHAFKLKGETSLDCLPSRNPHDPSMQERRLELGFRDWSQDNEKREF